MGNRNGGYLRNFQEGNMILEWSHVKKKGIGKQKFVLWVGISFSFICVDEKVLRSFLRK